jgi:nuclear pore complex protein Nup54
MVPVLAVGFQDLKKRLDSQDAHTKAHKDKLAQIQTEMEDMERKHALTTLVHLGEYKRRHLALVHKVVQVCFFFLK